MAHYFFDLHECGTVTADEVGLERAGLDAVRVEALRAAREVMCAEVHEGRLCLSCSIEVRDSAGQVALSLPFKDAISINGL